MSKFTFICEDDDGAMYTASQTRDDLDILLIDFQNFLRGSGFVFDGEITIVDEENSIEYQKGYRTPEGYIVPANPFNFSRDLPNRNPKE